MNRIEAIDSNEEFYTTGVKCRACGVKTVRRTTTGECQNCGTISTNKDGIHKMARCYTHSNGTYAQHPETRAGSVKFNDSKYMPMETCKDHGGRKMLYVATGNCHGCQLVKMEFIRHIVKHGLAHYQDHEMRDSPFKPARKVDWLDEIEATAKLIIDNGYKLAVLPCSKHGHVHYTDEGGCIQCRGMPSNKELAKANGDEWYPSTSKCKGEGCSIKTLRRTTTGECQNCGHTPKVGAEVTPSSVLMKESPETILSRVDSELQGLKVHRNGGTCKNGHTGWRYNSTGNCIDCANKVPPVEGYVHALTVKATTTPAHDARETADSIMMREEPDMVIDRATALEMGLKVYRTGNPCKSGHTGWRYAKGCACIQCLRGK